MLKSISIKLLDTNIYLLFLSIIIISSLTGILFNELYITEKIYSTTFSNQSKDNIGKLIRFLESMKIFLYLINPLLLLIKFILVTSCIATGSLLTGYKLSINQILRITIIGEIVFIVFSIIKFTTVYFANLTNLNDINHFIPFSILSIFNIETLEKWQIYPLGILNLFELFYVLFIAYLIGIISNNTYKDSLSFVLKTYGIGLVIFIIFVVFLIINFTH